MHPLAMKVQQNGYKLTSAAITWKEQTVKTRSISFLIHSCSTNSAALSMLCHIAYPSTQKTKQSSVTYDSQSAVMFQGRGVQPCNTAGPNAHNQIGPWATPACVKLCWLDNSLVTYGRLAIPFKNRNARFKIWILEFPQATKFQLPGRFWPAGCSPLVWGIGKTNIVSLIWRLLLENSWVWQLHRFRRNEFSHAG